MRTRAYRPEVSDCLEERSLLSGVAGLSAHHPVVLLRRKIIQVHDQVDLAFTLFARDVETTHLLDEIHDTVVVIPFGRVDGLGVKIKRIVDRLEDERSAHVPHAILSARNDVLAAIRAQVAARVRAGSVVVR